MLLQSLPNGEADGQRPAISISAVERETGILKETLRMWERRYGFPTPGRSPSGERFYRRTEVLKLRQLKLLIDKGYRPGSIVGKSLDELRGMDKASRPEPVPDANLNPRRSAHSTLETALRLVQTSHTGELHNWLHVSLRRDWVQEFVLEIVRPLAAEIARAGESGELPDFAQRLVIQQLETLLRAATSETPPSSATPRILLTTLPGENRRLELLMTQALHVAAGAACMSLGTETPIEEIARGAASLRADIIVLPFGPGYPMRKALANLRDLRTALGSEKIAIWASGVAVRRISGRLPGVTILPELEDGMKALADWAH